MTINSWLSGHNFKIVPLQLDIDKSDEGLYKDEGLFPTLSTKSIIVDIIRQLAFSIPGMKYL